MASKITTICGIAPHAAKKICRYAFRKHFRSLVLNQQNASYDIVIYKEVDGEGLDKDHLKDFKDFWGSKQWILYYADTNPL